MSRWEKAFLSLILFAFLWTAGVMANLQFRTQRMQDWPRADVIDASVDIVSVRRRNIWPRFEYRTTYTYSAGGAVRSERCRSWGGGVESFETEAEAIEGMRDLEFPSFVLTDPTNPEYCVSGLMRGAEFRLVYVMVISGIIFFVAVFAIRRRLDAA